MKGTSCGSAWRRRCVTDRSWSTRAEPSLPDVPTFVEAGYDIVAENWLGVSAPAGVADEIKAKLDTALTAAMDMDDVKAQFDTWGLIREPKTSDEFSAYVADQLTKWTPLVTAASQ